MHAMKCSACTNFEVLIKSHTKSYRVEVTRTEGGGMNILTWWMSVIARCGVIRMSISGNFSEVRLA
eukprot:574543-Pleurochrysis_carterae.AAC.1